MKFIIKDILIICLFCCASSLNAQHAFPYKNPLLPTEERVNDLLNRMTVTGKNSSNQPFAIVGGI